MKTLNQLTKQERLELYKAALVNWTRFPCSFVKKTHIGLCTYFALVHDVSSVVHGGCSSPNEYECNVNRIKGLNPYIDKIGKPEKRIEALKNMIAQLEQELLNETK